MQRRRHGWLRGGVGWSICFFVAGCLFHHAGDSLTVTTGAEQRDSTGESMVVQPARSAPELEPLSNYHLLPVARSASVDPPLESILLEMAPKIEPSSTRPPEAPVRTVTSEPSRPAPVKEESPLVAALRCALEKHPKKAQALLQQYDPSDRALLLALLSLTAGLGEGELPKLPAAEVERTLDQLHSLTLHLRQRARLSLGTVCFCRKIENFGQFIPMPGHYEYQAGEDGRAGERVQVYAEVRNFRSVLRNGQYETCLLCSLSVHDENGVEKITNNLAPCIDRSQSPRQDYFLNFQFNVFPKLPPGLYTLWVTVKDVTPAGPGQPIGPRVARRSLDFRVCPPGTRASAQP
jgi:hypothetical protein